MTRKTLNNKTHKRNKLRYLVYSIVVLFFVFFLTGILVLANGYLPSYKDGRISFHKTGMIILSVRPLDARILINSKFKEKSAFYLLQNKLGNLIPGVYNIRIEKKGFRTWEKNITVDPGLVSWANYVLLFPDVLDIRTLSEPAGKLFATSRDRDNLLFTESREGSYSAISVGASGAVTKSFWPKSTDSFPDWLKSPQVLSANYSSGSDKVLFEIMNGDIKEYVVAEPNGSDIRMTILNDQMKQNPESVMWDPYDNNSLFMKVSGSLYHLPQSATSLNTAISGNVISFTPEANRQLYFATKSDSGTVSIFKSSFDGSNLGTVLDSQATSGNYRFAHTNFNDTLAILNNDNGELLLVSPTNGDHGTIVRLGKGYRDISWQKSGQKLLYYNESSIFRYDLERKKQFVYSYGNKIESVNWYYDESHYLVNGEKGLEIMDYDGVNNVSLSFTQVNTVLLDTNNNNLVFSTGEAGKATFFAFSSPY